MKRYQINLIKKKEEGVVNRLVYFFLHYLRYIIVITQIVVIAVFFYRFQIDQEIIDLKESIDQKREILKVTRPLIVDASAIDGKVDEVKKIIALQGKLTDNYTYIITSVPAEVTITRLDIDTKEIKITGISSSIAAIRAFSDRIKRDGRFKGSELSQVSKSTLGFQFSIKISLK